MARKLRIAVSVFFGLLTVALCVLWVRSFAKHEGLRYRGSKALIISTTWRGNVVFLRHQMPITKAPHSWSFESTAYRGEKDMTLGGKPVTGKTIVYNRSANAHMVAIPCWQVFLGSVIFAFAPWTLHRFSLRTLLISMTLVAVAMGLGVWLAS